MIFKRAWRLQIEIDGVIKTYQELEYNNQSLRVDFNITNMRGGGFANGDITIYGLNDYDLQYLATSFNPIQGSFKQNKVSLEVGYHGKIGVIMNGSIFETDADLTSIDRKITLKVMGGIANNLLRNNVTNNIKGKTDFKAICNQCAEQNGLKLKYDDGITPRVLYDYAFNGTPFQQIMDLRKYFSDIDIFIDEKGTFLNVFSKDNQKVKNPEILSVETGLVGTPKPTNTGLQVISLLNINLKCGGFVKLQNTLFKKFDGTYNILELKHLGSNISNQWITQLLLKKVKS